MSDAIEKVRWALHTSATSRKEHYDALDRLDALVRAAEEVDALVHYQGGRLDTETVGRIYAGLAAALRAVKGEQA